MTRQEFIRLHDSAARKANKRGLIVVGFGCVAIVVMMVGAAPLHKYLDQHDYFLGVIKSYMITGFAGVMVILFGVLLKLVRPPLGVPCPSCGDQIVGINARLVAITGNCSHCGERVFRS